MDSYQSEQLDALGDATRRAILSRLLKDGPLRVGTLAEGFPVSRPAISQHLRILKQANLVTERADGASRLYAVNPEALAALRAHFERYWTQALRTFKREAEAKPPEVKVEAGPHESRPAESRKKKRAPKNPPAGKKGTK